jgi:hypothetical protein
MRIHLFLLIKEKNELKKMIYANKNFIIIWMMLNVINLLIETLEIKEEDNREKINIYDVFMMFILILMISLLYIVEYLIYPLYIIEYLFINLCKKDINKNDIILEMTKLDEIKDEITSGEYLFECNRLMNKYNKCIKLI